MRSVDLLILRWPSQSLTREAYVVPSAEVPILGVDIDAIGADSLGVTAMLLLVFLDLRDQVLIVRIPADPVQEGKAIAYRDTDLGPKFHSRPCLAANNGTNIALNQVDDAIWDASRPCIQQDRLLSVQLADHEKLPPPMRLKSRKPCARGDQGINGIKISLQVIELTAYRCFDFPATKLFLFGDIEKSSSCLTTIVSRLMPAMI